MKNIKILEVNNIDTIGSSFNGYELISDLSSSKLDIKQAVIYKNSDNKNVVKIIEDDKMDCFNELITIEEKFSIHNLLSISSPLLKRLDEYKNCDIIHIHMFHNTKLSLASLKEIANEKKVIISLHDPWFLTGRCVHFNDCNKWENGCENCFEINTYFPFTQDNCHNMWKIKEEVLNNPNIYYVAHSKWIYNVALKSKFIKDKSNIYLIPFGIDLKKFDKKKVNNNYNISDDYIKLFFRAQVEFKGLYYIKEALKKLKTDKKLAIITCDNKGLLKDLEDKYKIVELGMIKQDEIINVYNLCDIFLMPSIAETFGMMAVEAMACEKPVIVFDNTALPSVTNAPECGFLVENKNSDKLCDAIKYLIENEDERLKRGRLGRKYCEENYSKKYYLSNMEKMYLDVNSKKHYINSSSSYDDLDYIEFKDRILKSISDRTYNFPFKDLNLDYINRFNEDIYSNYLTYINQIPDFNPKISVIIPVYNGDNYINEAIDSVLAQTYKNYEIIVVDDGSTDKTRKVVEKYKGKIKYFYKQNGGVASALNYGISKMTGEYFAWLSHDDLYLPDKLEIQVNCMRSLINKKTILFSNFDLMDFNYKIFSHFDCLKDTTTKELCIGYYPVVKGCINGCTILINKDCFSEVGLFDEKLRTSQDYDMWLRLFKKYPSYSISKTLVKYRIHPKQDTNSNVNTPIEGNRFWNYLVENLKEKEIISWDKNPFEVYMALSIQMNNSGFLNASKMAYDKALKCFKNNKVVFSVVIPCYNAEKYLNEALESLRNQTYTNFEAIIVDDHSTDKSFEIASEFCKKDFRFKVVKNKKTKGVSGALNTGIELSNGNYFARLDADDILLPNKLLMQYRELNSKNIGYVATNINLMNSNSVITKISSYQKTDVPIEFLSAFQNPIPNATIAYRMDYIKKYDLSFKSISTSEDYNFLLNYIYTTKSKGFFIDEALYNYRILDNSLFHSNINLSIEYARKFAEEYYKKISKNLDYYYKYCHEFYYDGFDINKVDIKKYINVLRKFYESVIDYFDYSDDEKNNIILYIAQKCNKNEVEHKNSRIVKEKKQYVPNTKLGNKYMYYYRTHGFLKTAIWIGTYPVKFFKRKILKK